MIYRFRYLICGLTRRYAFHFARVIFYLTRRRACPSGLSVADSGEGSRLRGNKAVSRVETARKLNISVRALGVARARIIYLRSRVNRDFEIAKSRARYFHAPPLITHDELTYEWCTLPFRKVNRASSPRALDFLGPVALSFQECGPKRCNFPRERERERTAPITGIGFQYASRRKCVVHRARCTVSCVCTYLYTHTSARARARAR